MLNQQDGFVLFGISVDGSTIGQEASERTIEEVSAEVSRIEPPAFSDDRASPGGGRQKRCGRIRARGPHKTVHVHQGTAYREVGNTTLAMSVDEYNPVLFERVHSEQRWENQSATGRSIKWPVSPGAWWANACA